MEQRQPSPTPDLASKHAEDLQRLRNFRLLDDDFMSKVFEDTACTELLLQIILDRSDLKVQSVHSQHEIKNLQGRSKICRDVPSASISLPPTPPGRSATSRFSAAIKAPESNAPATTAA